MKLKIKAIIEKYQKEIEDLEKIQMISFLYTSQSKIFTLKMVICDLQQMIMES
jgi:hypothetical protein